MALELLSLSTANYYAPYFEIEIDNQKLSADMSKSILDISIEEKLDEGASFRMTLHDGFDMRMQKFKWLDHELINVGNKISIKAGYSGNLVQMITGKITSIEASFFTGELPNIIINGQDMSYDYIKRPSPERTFIRQKYSDIARSIANEAKLSCVTDDSSLIINFIRKNSTETYYLFLLRLSQEINFEFNIQRQTLYFINPQDNSTEILTLSLGKDIISFRPSYKTSGLVTEVEVRSHNSADPSNPFVGRAFAGNEQTHEAGTRTGSQIASERVGTIRRVITNIPVTSQEHANAIAIAELNRASNSLIEGEGECIGIPQLKPGVTIKLDKLGERFSGKYYVKETTHTINLSGYRTRFLVRRNSL